MKTITQLLRHPPVWVLVLIQLLILLGAVWSAVQPAAVYTFTPDQWMVIAENSDIGYDEEGRRGVTEMTDWDVIM